MSSSDYLKMVEVPVDTCDVVVKPKRRKKKDVKEEVIEMVNDDNVTSTESVSRRLAKKPKSIYNRLKKKDKNKKVNPVESETTTVKSSRFDIVSVQVVAIFVLVIGIILTNVFIEDSGMNNLLRSMFGTNEATSNLSTATYSEFEPLSPSKTGEVTLNNGVMTVSSGSVYAPCDGIVESVSEVDGKYNVTVRHSESFTTVIKGIELCYLSEGDDVYSSIALGYSAEALEVSMFNDNSLITDYSFSDGEIVWLV